MKINGVNSTLLQHHFHNFHILHFFNFYSSLTGVYKDDDVSKKPGQEWKQNKWIAASA